MVEDARQSVPGKDGWRLIFECRQNVFEINTIIAGSTNIPVKPKLLNPTCKGSFEWKGKDGETCRVNAEVMYYEYETSKKVGFRIARVDPDYVTSKTGQILVAGGRYGIMPNSGLSLKCYPDGRLQRSSLEEVAAIEPYDNVPEQDRRRYQENYREYCQVAPERNWDPTVAR